MATITRERLNQYLSDGWKVQSRRNLDQAEEIELTRKALTNAGVAKRVASVPVGLVTAPVGLAFSIVTFVVSGIIYFPSALAKGWNPCHTVAEEDKDAERWGRSYNYRHGDENRPGEYASLPLIAGLAAPAALWSDGDYELERKTFRVLRS